MAGQQESAQNSTSFRKSIDRVSRSLARFTKDIDPALRYKGASVYVMLPDHFRQAGVIATTYGPRADRPYREFLGEHILRRRIALHGTAAGETLRRPDGADMLVSGYQKGHLCLNFGAGREALAQVVFDLADNRTDIDKTMRGLKKSFARSALRSQLRYIARRHKGEVDSLDFRPLKPRDVMFMYADITGYTAICDELGNERAFDLIAKVREDIFVTQARPYYGERFKSDGDSLWFVFPCTGIGEKEKTAFAKNEVIEAGNAIMKAYDTFRRGHFSEAVRRSFIKIGVTEDQLRIVPEPGRYYDMAYDSPALARLKFMVEGVAPRGRDVLLVDDILARRLETESFRTMNSTSSQGAKKGHVKTVYEFMSL